MNITRLIEQPNGFHNSRTREVYEKMYRTPLNSLDCMKSYKLMAEYGCVRDDYMNALANSNWNTALNHRKDMARLYEDFMTMFIERTANVSDLGAICHHEIVNWYQLVQLETDDELEAGLGGSIPSDANPTTDYLGSAFVKVVLVETLVNAGEALTLEVHIMENPTSATLYYRPLGGGSYSSIDLTQVARGVYEVTIPAQPSDFEYYIEAETPIGNATFPVTASSINQSVVVWDTVTQTERSVDSTVSQKKD